MAGLIDLVRRGRFKSTDTVVFVHTGGVPALFAYQDIFYGGLEPRVRPIEFVTLPALRFGSPT